MTFNNTHKLLAGTIALVLVGGMTSPAFAQIVDITSCTVDPAEVNLQLGSDETSEIIQKTITCDNDINDFIISDDCIFNSPDFDNDAVLQSVLTLNETVTNNGDTSEEHCEVNFQIFGFGDISNNVNVTQALWINAPVEPPTPVAGELLALDTSALLIGGLPSFAVWMVPVVAGIVGSGMYLAKFRANKE
ncbi:MAG TPA: hypothetical protein VMW55_01160 [Nitrosopumilaceae archaeon]|nr:hypothetical protein [Nitrosopumilaceae archaeon]